MTDSKRSSAIAVLLIDRIEPILAGHPSEVQGAVLCDLTLTWLMGHIAADGNQRHTRQIRRHILRLHSDYIWQMVRQYEATHEPAHGTQDQGARGDRRE